MKYDNLRDTDSLTLCGGIEGEYRVKKTKLISEMTDEELREHCKKLGDGTLTDEQLKSQRSIWESFERSDYLKKNNPEVDYTPHPECQIILQKDILPTEKITELVDLFRKEYPGYILPEDKDLWHPSALALHKGIDLWLIEQCGLVEFFTLMVKAAKIWFPDKLKTKLGKTFCTKFEIRDCTFWHGQGTMESVCKEYYDWRHDRFAEDT